MGAATARLTLDEAERLAISALTFLAEDEARLRRFLDLTGLSPATLKTEAGRPVFLAAALEHLMGDESLLLTFAANTGTDPSLIADARRTLDGGRDA